MSDWPERVGPSHRLTSRYMQYIRTRTGRPLFADTAQSQWYWCVLYGREINGCMMLSLHS